MTERRFPSPWTVDWDLREENPNEVPMAETRPIASNISKPPTLGVD
jgi:hypothetical protein